MKRLAVIDGKSVFYRGYYSMPGLSLRDGTPTGGVFGFANLSIELIKKLAPDYVAVAWDKPKTNIRKRREIYPEYKAGRKPAPPDFYAQIPLLHEMLEAFGWPLYELDDYEADDIMGAFAKQAEKKGIETCLLTSDLDVLQLISPQIKVYAIKNGLSNIEEFDVAHFEQKYGINVHQFLDLKSLKGDSSDNIPGVPGVGEKTGIQLLQEFKTLDNIYKNLDSIKPSVAKKLEAGKDSAFMSREIAEIWTDIPIELDWKAADINGTDLGKVADILKKFEFSSLIKRLPDHMKQTPDKVLHFHESAEVALSESPWPETLNLDQTVALHIESDNLWLSPNRTTVYTKKLEDVPASAWSALSMSKVVSYDLKNLYHQLDAKHIDIKFDEIHDIRQAAYLIDPLRRDRSLASLVGGELDTPGDVVAASWQVYDWQVEAFKNLPKVKNIAEQFDFPLTYILFKIEKIGIKIDKKFLANMSTELGEKYNELQQKIYDIVGDEFNIGSPAQLSQVLFTTLGLPTAGIKKGKTGFSTGQKELDKLRGQHPIIELIEQTRELAKLKNTYVDTLPEQTDTHDRLHTTFNQDVAPTGRLSSTDPNLQNIPIRSELGQKVRNAFIPEKGNVFVSADYSQFELRLAAALADDIEMINDFNSDIDIHTKTASDVYGIPMDAVTKNERRHAKVINFGVLYGMSPHGLSAATGMTFVEARAFIDHYFEKRAPIRRYIDTTLENAEKNGYVETFFGRRRPTPDIKSSNFMVREAAKRSAANMPIQGTEADLMKLAMIKIESELGDLGDQVMQVHDSIMVECQPENAEKIGDMMLNIMENICPELKIKLKVDVSIGKNWGEL